ERIFGYGAKNWWSRAGAPSKMPAGEPGGPDSEMFYEFTHIEHDKKYGEQCHPNCDCGRFLEVGNSVFMEYKKLENGSFEKLKQRNVDFGGGLERITAASNNDPDVFHIDVFKAMQDALALAGPWQKESLREVRIILDHMRAAIFLIGDGIMPSNKGQGYVLRRLLRRAALYARNVFMQSNYREQVANVVPAAIEIYKDYYEDLGFRGDDI